VPGGVDSVRVESRTSKSVVLSWSELDCSQRNGPSVGYSCELTSDADGTTIRRQAVNDTQLEFSQLVPFTWYSFSVSFRNADFDGPKTLVNFITDEDGLWHTLLVSGVFN